LCLSHHGSPPWLRFLCTYVNPAFTTASSSCACSQSCQHCHHDPDAMDDDPTIMHLDHDTIW
jgi:hypothetical protein